MWSSSLDAQLPKPGHRWSKPLPSASFQADDPLTSANAPPSPFSSLFRPPLFPFLSPWRCIRSNATAIALGVQVAAAAAVGTNAGEESDARRRRLKWGEGRRGRRAIATGDGGERRGGEGEERRQGSRGLVAWFYRANPTLYADPLFSHAAYTRDTPQNWAREKRRPTSHSLMQKSTMCR